VCNASASVAYSIALRVSNAQGDFGLMGVAMTEPARAGKDGIDTSAQPMPSRRDPRPQQLIEAFKVACAALNHKPQWDRPVAGILHLEIYKRTSAHSEGFGVVLIVDYRAPKVQVQNLDPAHMTDQFLKQFKAAAKGLEFEIVPNAAPSMQGKAESKDDEHQPKGRRPRYSFEKMYDVVMKWRDLKKANSKHALDTDDIDGDNFFDAGDGGERKQLEEFLIDEFGMNERTRKPKVSERTFQQWGGNFDTGHWDIPTSHKHKKRKK
jgi:hypothetical protein